jgi:hypothetical protein
LWKQENEMSMKTRIVLGMCMAVLVPSITFAQLGGSAHNVIVADLRQQGDQLRGSIAINGGTRDPVNNLQYSLLKEGEQKPRVTGQFKAKAGGIEPGKQSVQMSFIPFLDVPGDHFVLQSIMYLYEFGLGNKPSMMFFTQDEIVMAPSGGMVQQTRRVAFYQRWSIDQQEPFELPINRSSNSVLTCEWRALPDNDPDPPGGPGPLSEVVGYRAFGANVDVTWPEKVLGGATDGGAHIPIKASRGPIILDTTTDENGDLKWFDPPLTEGMFELVLDDLTRQQLDGCGFLLVQFVVVQTKNQDAPLTAEPLVARYYRLSDPE